MRNPTSISLRFPFSTENTACMTSWNTYFTVSSKLKTVLMGGDAVGRIPMGSHQHYGSYKSKRMASQRSHYLYFQVL